MLGGVTQALTARADERQAKEDERTRATWLPAMSLQIIICMNSIVRVRQPHARRSRRGFTMIELMATVVVLSVLASLAIPSFINAIRKSRRSDGIAALAAVQQGQERYRSTNASYATSAQFASLGVPSTSSSGYYTVSIAAADATGYTAVVDAVGGSTQANDSGCQSLGARMAAGTLSYGSGSSSASLDWTDAKRCWAR